MNQLINLFQLYPPLLLILTVVLVILPTIIAIMVRVRLYHQLSDSAKKVQRLIQRGESRGQQPPIVHRLEERFTKASINLEQINTSALIDSVYSQEKLTILGLTMGYDFIDYYCRILPNLLLSFGLLGTFIGITVNLYNLGQSINIDQADINDISNLIEKLQQPLEGMGIAFISSLFAVLCSSILTIINLKFNTSLVKYKLISILEDYLDNIFCPGLPTHTRMDKAVDRLVDQFTGFLYRFGDTVRDAVERSLGEQINKIVEVNETSAKLAEQVYTRLLEASSSLDSSARTFKEAANTIEKSKFADKLVNTTTELDQIYSNFANSTVFLEESSQLIKDSLEKFQSSIDGMVILGNQITHLNEQSNNLLKLNENQIKTEREALTNIQSEITKLVESLNQNQQAVHNDLQILGKRLVSNLSEQIGQNNCKVEVISNKLDSYVGNLNKIHLELTQLVTSLRNHEKQLNSELQKLGDCLVSSFDKNMNSNNSQLKFMVETLQQYLSNLHDNKLLINQLFDKFESLNSERDNTFNYSSNNERLSDLKDRFDDLFK